MIWNRNTLVEDDRFYISYKERLPHIVKCFNIHYYLKIKVNIKYKSIIFRNTGSVWIHGPHISFVTTIFLKPAYHMFVFPQNVAENRIVASTNEQYLYTVKLRDKEYRVGNTHAPYHFTANSAVDLDFTFTGNPEEKYPFTGN